MSAKKKVAILLHARDRYPKTGGHFIWWLCDVWRTWNIEIEVLYGIGKSVDCDLLIAHLDVTVVPPDYLDYLAKYPRVVNGAGRHDISKRRISANLLSRGDAYDGPAIVKTNLNCGGVTDLEFPGGKVVFSAEKPPPFWKSLLQKQKRSSDWARINCIPSAEYQVFDSLAAVPEAVFENPALVVERFLPEYENGAYQLRYYMFLGDHSYGSLMRSSRPIVKRLGVLSRQPTDVAAEVVAFRHELKLDYGKIDYVMRNGKAVVLDVNRTPGQIASIPEREGYAAQVAPGIRSFLD